MGKVTASIYHDTRYKKVSGTYPVKLKVYHDKEQRFYPLNIDLTKEDYERAYQSLKPKQEYREIKLKLDAHLTNALTIIDKLPVFTFDLFERRLALGTNSANVIALYDEVITSLRNDDRVNTLYNYRQSLRSLLLFEVWNNGGAPEPVGKRSAEEYIEYLKGKVKKLPLIKITPQYLNDYERWVLNECKGKLTTVGIYLRPLRSIYLTAIADKFIDEAYYPFAVRGQKNKYEIPGGVKTKKALDMDKLGILFNAPIPEDRPLQAKARDFWYFSYQGNGMNVADYSRLKWGNINGNTIEFFRQKTNRTKKKQPIKIQVLITDYLQHIIDKYGNADRHKDNYIFPIINKSMNETEKVAAIATFTRFVNQHMKLLAESCGITSDISTNWGRHSFTTIAVNEGGATLEQIRESLGHGSTKTTERYFAGIKDEKKKGIAEMLMPFAKPNPENEG